MSASKSTPAGHAAARRGGTSPGSRRPSKLSGGRSAGSKNEPGDEVVVLRQRVGEPLAHQHDHAALVAEQLPVGEARRARRSRPRCGRAGCPPRAGSRAPRTRRRRTVDDAVAAAPRSTVRGPLAARRPGRRRSASAWYAGSRLQVLGGGRWRGPEGAPVDEEPRDDAADQRHHEQQVDRAEPRRVVDREQAEPVVDRRQGRVVLLPLADPERGDVRTAGRPSPGSTRGRAAAGAAARCASR